MSGEPGDASGSLESPSKRSLLLGAGIAVAAVATGKAAAQSSAAGRERPVRIPPAESGPYQWDESSRSPWGAPPKAPPAVLPAAALPDAPRPYTEIDSYHAHIYFDDDTAYRAVQLRDWVIRRFRIELGEWNEGPRGPHTTPSFYFGFTNDLVPQVIPWLMLNHLGLKILIHPNTDDPYADHLINALWIGDTQPVNAFRMPRSATAAGGDIERIYPNTIPTIELES